MFFAHILLRPSPLVLQVLEAICGVLQAGVALYDIEKLLKSSETFQRSVERFS